MLDYLIKGETLTVMADGVRNIFGTSDKYTPEEMASVIARIEASMDISDATATATEILNGKTAYVKDGKVTGTFTIDSELITQDSLITQIQAAVDSLPEAGGSGGGASLETITVSYPGLPDPGTEIYYIDGTMTMQHTLVYENASYTMIKGTIFIITNYVDSDFGGCASICGNGMCKAFYAYPSS